MKVKVFDIIPETFYPGFKSIQHLFSHLMCGVIFRQVVKGVSKQSKKENQHIRYKKN